MNDPREELCAGCDEDTRISDTRNAFDIIDDIDRGWEREERYVEIIEDE